MRACSCTCASMYYRKDFDICTEFFKLGETTSLSLTPLFLFLLLFSWLLLPCLSTPSVGTSLSPAPTSESSVGCTELPLTWSISGLHWATTDRVQPGPFPLHTSWCCCSLPNNKLVKTDSIPSTNFQLSTLRVCSLLSCLIFLIIHSEGLALLLNSFSGSLCGLWPQPPCPLLNCYPSTSAEVVSLSIGILWHCLIPPL